MLLDYVDSCERRFKYKSLKPDYLTDRIKLSGVLAHQLLKCKCKADFSSFITSAKQKIIDNPKHNNSTLCVMLENAIENIYDLKIVDRASKAVSRRDVKI